MPNITAKIIKKGAEGKGYLSGVEVKCSTGVVQPLTIDKPPPNCEIEVKTALIPDCGECANPCGYNVLVKIDTTANNTCEGKGAPPCGDELNPSGIEIDCLNKKLDTSPLGVCKSLCESKYPSDVKWVSYESSGSEEDCEREKNLDDCMDCCSNGCPDDTNGDCIENCIECKNKCPDETSTGNCETTHCKENCNECVDKCGSDEECIKECGNCIDECIASGQYAYLKNPSLERQVCACSECNARCTCNAYVICSSLFYPDEVDENGCGCFTDSCGKRRCCPIDAGWGGDILGSQNPPGCESDCIKRCQTHSLESEDETRQRSCYTDCIDEMNAVYEACPCELDLSYPGLSRGGTVSPIITESGLCNCDKFEYKLLNGTGTLGKVSGIFTASNSEDCDPVTIQVCCTNCNDSETCSDPVTLNFSDTTGCCIEGMDCNITGSDTMTTSDTNQMSTEGSDCGDVDLTWSIEGTDASISNAGIVTTGSGACGAIKITLKCSDLTLSTFDIRVTDAGQWSDPVVCNTEISCHNCGSGCASGLSNCTIETGIYKYYTEDCWIIVELGGACVNPQPCCYDPPFSCPSKCETTSPWGPTGPDAVNCGVSQVRTWIWECV